MERRPFGLQGNRASLLEVMRPHKPDSIVCKVFPDIDPHMLTIIQQARIAFRLGQQSCWGRIEEGSIPFEQELIHEFYPGKTSWDRELRIVDFIFSQTAINESDCVIPYNFRLPDIQRGVVTRSRLTPHEPQIITPDELDVNLLRYIAGINQVGQVPPLPNRRDPKAVKFYRNIIKEGLRKKMGYGPWFINGVNLPIEFVIDEFNLCGTVIQYKLSGKYTHQVVGMVGEHLNNGRKPKLELIMLTDLVYSRESLSALVELAKLLKKH